MNTPDPHLRQALAHAPDADVKPPAHVSAQILAAAHRQAAEPSPPERPATPPWWRRPWGASGALATVLMAGALGLLWQGQLPGPATEKAAEAPHVTAQPNATPPAPAQEPAAAQVRAEVRQVTAAPVVPAARPRAAVAPQLPAAATAPAGIEVPAPLADAAARSAAPLPAAPPPPAMVAAPAPTPAPAPAAAPAPARAARLAAAQAASPVLPAWQPTDRWRWIGETSRPLPDAAWVRQLLATARAPWTRAEPPSEGLAMPPLRWLRDGASLGSVRLAADGWWWCPEGQPCWRVAVEPAVMGELLAHPVVREPGTR